MEIIRVTYPPDLTKMNLKPSSVAFGNFDGVHIGHQQVVRRAVQIAKEQGIRAGVMTFSPHPLEVLGKVEHPSYLSPLDDKMSLLQELEVDFVFVVEFTAEFARLSAEEFIKKYIVDLHIKHVVTGFDFSFGYRGSGTVELLKQWGMEQQAFSTDVLPSVDQDEQKVSSSRIRSLLQEGRVEAIYPLLQRFYQVKGKVIHGEKRGRLLGFPTANLQLEAPYVLPKLGVYAVYTTIQGKRWPGVCNIGKKPTFHDHNRVSFEVHILDYEGDLYDQSLRLEFVSFLRAEKKFNSLEELVEQIGSDVEKAKQILS